VFLNIGGSGVSWQIEVSHWREYQEQQIAEQDLADGQSPAHPYGAKKKHQSEDMNVYWKPKSTTHPSYDAKNKRKQQYHEMQ
jgi:hypothetical protein